MVSPVYPGAARGRWNQQPARPFGHGQETPMPSTLIARFTTRRDAEMTVEQLVQTLEIERTMVFVASAEAANTAGIEPDGSDLVEGEPDPDANPALEQLIVVSVDLEDDGLADAAEAVFRDHGALDIDRR
jgi:hypothetical protein